MGLPLKLVNELDEVGIDKRITYFAGYFDEHGLLNILEKIVYGEIEFTHQYEYDRSGGLRKATLLEDDEPPRIFEFGPGGEMVEVVR